MKWFLSVLLVMMSLPSLVTHASEDLSELYGRYQGSYEQTTFEISLNSNGQMALKHPKYGLCSSGDKSYNRYRLYTDNSGIVLEGVSPIIRAFGVIFCQKFGSCKILMTALAIFSS